MFLQFSDWSVFWAEFSHWWKILGRRVPPSRDRGYCGPYLPPCHTYLITQGDNITPPPQTNFHADFLLPTGRARAPSDASIYTREGLDDTFPTSHHFRCECTCAPLESEKLVSEYFRASGVSDLNPLRAAAPFWGQTTPIGTAVPFWGQTTQTLTIPFRRQTPRKKKLTTRKNRVVPSSKRDCTPKTGYGL